MASKAASNAASSLLEFHPLQRLPSPSRSFSAFLHVAGLSSFFLAFKHLIDNPNDISASYGWHLQFLTIIGLALATLTYSVALLADLTLSPRIFLIKNAISVSTTPLEVLISALYWTIMAIDPRLVLPDWLEPLPLLDDMNFHMFPALFLTVDLLFFSPPWTISALPALGISASLATAYWYWIEKCHSVNGFYPYPLFDVDPQSRMLVFAGAAMVMTASTLSLKKLYSVVNGHSVIQSKGRNIKARPGAVKRA